MKLNSSSVKPGTKLEVERFLFELARKFVHITHSEVDQEIQTGLASITRRAGADRGYVYFFRQNNTRLEIVYKFYPEKIKEKIPQHDQVNGDDFAWLIHSVLNGKTLNMGSLSQLPPSAATIRMIMEVELTKSALICPLISDQKVIGLIGLDAVNHEQIWPAESEHLLRNSADIFAAALERKNTVREGIRTEQRMRALFTGIEDVVFITTPEGKILEINPAGAKLFGFSSIKELLAILDVKELYQNSAERTAYKKAIEETGHVKDFELKLKRKDGKQLIVLETATAVRDEDNNLLAYEGIIRDITDTRDLEQQLFQAQKMESIGLLAGGIAHDFNNILTALNGYAQIILMQGKETDPAYKNAKNILQSSKKAEDLIRQLLGFSRKQMVELDVLDINQVISEMYKMLSRLISEDIEFDLQLEKKCPAIKADTVQLQQILVNLVVNAGQALAEIRSTAYSKHITVQTNAVTLNSDFTDKHPGSRIGKYVLITVKDTGIGMDEETRQKIFEPFFSTKKEKGGSGLGLSTVYGIVKQNLGYIIAESQPGSGTTFKIYWPSTTEDKRKTTVPDSDMVMETYDETILVVEDDDEVRQLANTGLTAMGYTIIEARNGRHALKIIQRKNISKKIDLVISDMVMPEMGGEELAQNLRKLNPEIKILLCSGYTDSRIFKLESDGLEGYSFLAKPYTIPKLANKIRTVLRQGS